MTLIADMVTRLIAAGTPPEVAAEVVAEAFAAGAVRRQSAEHPVDVATEKRRAYDRERQRKIRELRRQSAEHPPMSRPALTLSSDLENQDQPKKEKKVRARKAVLPPDWQPSEGHFQRAADMNIPRHAVIEKAEDMRLWHKASGELKMDWDATFDGFLRRDASKLASGGSRGPPRERPMSAIELELQNSQRNGAHHDHEPADGDLLDLAAEPAGSRTG